MVTTITYPDGSTYTYEEYVGRSCDNCANVECLDPGPGGGGDGVGYVVTENGSFTTTEDNPDDAANAPRILYFYSWTLQTANDQVINVIRYPVTASPMISNYINNGVNTTRTLTLFNQTSSWTPTSSQHGFINWWFTIYGHYVYGNGTTRSYQWNRADVSNF